MFLKSFRSVVFGGVLALSVPQRSCAIDYDIMLWGSGIVLFHAIALGRSCCALCKSEGYVTVLASFLMQLGMLYYAVDNRNQIKKITDFVDAHENGALS